MCIRDSARRASADTAEGLERDLYLAKGAKVMLTKNLYQQVGLVNGIRGEVVELVYADDAVSYTHLRAHETRHDLVCRLLLEKKT